MRITTSTVATADVGYTMWLSARDTWNWAHRPGHGFPNSTTSDHRLLIVVDANGLEDFAVDGRGDNDQIAGHELDAIVSDHLPAHLRHLWPTWGVAPVAKAA